jgi:hypothetical protein
VHVQLFCAGIVGKQRPAAGKHAKCPWSATRGGALSQPGERQLGRWDVAVAHRGLHVVRQYTAAEKRRILVVDGLRGGEGGRKPAVTELEYHQGSPGELHRDVAGLFGAGSDVDGRGGYGTVPVTVPGVEQHIASVGSRHIRDRYVTSKQDAQLAQHAAIQAFTAFSAWAGNAVNARLQQL